MSNFLDQVEIKVRSGDGGNGMVAWRREKYEPNGGPAGGCGGRGGDVIIEATSDLSTLLDYRYKNEYLAENGQKGGSKNKYGRKGLPLVLKVPVGTVIRDVANDLIIADLCQSGQQALVAEGGQGGRGNSLLSSSTRRAPHFCEPGQPGIERQLRLTLKLIADVGLVGMPNAGKSTMLSVMTAAKPKIADYPFTTLEPNLGVVKNPGGDGFVMADIPGLIEGASKGVGLGHKFLRHIERTRLIVHIADITDPELENSIKTINNELALFDEKLSALPQILVLNKTDVLDPEHVEEIIGVIKKNIKELMGNCKDLKLIMSLSCATTDGIDKLRLALLEELAKLPKPEQIHDVGEDVHATLHYGEEFQVFRKKKLFFVEGDRVDRLVAVTDMKDNESLHHLFFVLTKMGVIDALLAEGVTPGNEIVVGGASFVFGEDMY